MRVLKSILIIICVTLLAFAATSCNDVTGDPSGGDTQKSDGTSLSTSGISDTESAEAMSEVILNSSISLSKGTVESYMNDPDLKLLVTPGTVLTAEDYVSLSEKNPSVKLLTKVDFGTFTVDMTVNECDISGNVITDKLTFEKVISNLGDGTKLIMCDCGFTNEEMGALREKYAAISFVWRIYRGKWSLLTDDEAFSVMIYASDTYTRLKSDDIKVLEYCTNLYALDLGHQELTDLTTIGKLTDLRVLILADNKITDLTPLSNLKNLQYLELFVNSISDVSPLAACTELLDLNFGWNRVYDLSSIYSLPKLERLWLPTNPVSAAKHDEIRANFSDAKIVFEDPNSISSGWRTHERYFSMRGMFDNNKYDPQFGK